MTDFQLDLHTHSIISYDGGITQPQFRRFFMEHPNFIVAVTDHNRIELALELKHKHPQNVIVGEEIMTQAGEIIGLFLTKLIPAKLSLQETIDQIRAQGGLVYVPHPLELRRQGLTIEALNSIKNSIDLLEVFNSRGIEPQARTQTEQFARENNIVGAASSDAHSASGLGTAYSVVREVPTAANLKTLLAQGTLMKKPASVGAMLAPIRNKLKKWFR